MAPRGTARLCSTCDKLVHDLSAMTEREARTLLRTQATRGLCIRYLHDATGEIWFGNGSSDGLVPASRLARRGAVMATAAALVLTPVLTEACGGANPNPNPYGNTYEAADASGATGQERRASDPSVLGADGGTDVASDGETDAARATETDAANATETDAANATETDAARATETDAGAADAGAAVDAPPE